MRRPAGKRGAAHLGAAKYVLLGGGRRAPALAGAGLALTLALWGGLTSPAWALEGPAPGAASPRTLTLPDRPGSIRGLADTASLNAFSGQVAYSVPLELPKGPGGFGPALAFTYVGDLGNGPMGVGWTLGEIAVRRTLRYGVPSYTSADELELVGVGQPGRLVDSGDGKTFWVCGQAKTVRVVKKGARFEVNDGNGTTYLLGATAAGRESDGTSRVSGWLVESATNVVGQQIRFTYERDQGQTYLASVEWGPGSILYRVELQYDGRDDVVVSYRPGYLVRTARLLTGVVVKVIEGGTSSVARSYELDYDRSFAASRLVRIQMNGRPTAAGTAEAFPPLTFGYPRPEPAAIRQLAGVDGWVLNQRGVTLLDVDGDGMSDLARLELGNHQYRKNTGGSFSAATTMGGASDVELEAAQLMDLDGDARPELVRIVDETWRAFRLVSGSWESMGTWPGTQGVPLQGAGVVLADLNGDGRTDVIRGGAGHMLVNFNGKTGMGPALSVPQISAGEAAVEPGNANVRFVDFNGDGLADVVYLTDAWMKIFLGRGDGTFVAWNRVYWPWGQAAFDVNDLHLADLDRDGLMDVVRFSAGHALFYPGLPNGHLSDAVRHLERPESADADAVVTVADVLGNGSQNVVWSSPRGLWALDLAGPTSGGMLTSIDNGLGKTTRFVYRSSALLTVDAEAQGDRWDVKLPVVVPVPVRTEIDLGPDTPLRIAHHGVRDGFWDGNERRFGGFLGSTEMQPTQTGPIDTLMVQTRYHAGIGDERVLRGVPLTVARTDGRGQAFDTQKVDWQALVLPGMPSDPCARRPVKLQEEGYFYEGVATARQTSVRYDAFDALGRPQRELHLGLVDVTGDEKLIVRSYADDDATWVRERVFSEQVWDGTGTTIASATQTFYGGPAGGPLPLGQIGQGLVREVRGMLGPTWPLQSARSYDACGNPTSIYEGGVTRAIGYDSCLFANSETLSPGGGKSPLVWTMTWDHVLGAPTLFVDPNQDATGIGYDGLGRPTAISVGAPAAIAQGAVPPHTHYAYEWIAPHPRTTTWVFDGSAAALDEPWPAGPHWRQTVAVANGAGEALFLSTPLGDGRYVVSGWRERDERGQINLLAEPFYSAVSLPTVQQAERVQNVHFDALGRLADQTLPNGASKHVRYVAFGQKVTTPELADVQSLFDGLGRIVHTERTVGVVESVDASYDPADRLTAMTLQNGVTHSFTPDELGRLVHADDPDTGPRTLVYDERNFLIDHQNGAGQHIYFSYDDAGRLLRRGETPALNALTDYTFSYDDPATALSSLGCHVLGRLSSATEPAGVATAPAGGSRFCYDMFGRQTGVGRNIVAAAGTKSASQTSELSPSGLLLQSQSDDLFAVGYKYDGAGRAVCIRTPPAGDPAKCRTLPGTASDDYWVADEIDAAGRVRHEHYGNGVVETYAYDDLGFTSHVQVTQPGGGPAANLFEIMVTRNSYGAPTIVDDLDTQPLDHSATYSYDAAARLTDATMGPTSDRYAFTYRYDALQNMTLRKVTRAGTAADIGALAGVYRYGERGYGPRQLTSVVPGGAP